eukprot:CAMPEP_0173171962 /NCGR_PEP_ID=MMETSP1141-20130122/2046_1 /TAXON_ID=483371 /ORGANISM="non described non described, Strain CCMP2298" /LENGTH=159 /DNA_ID=CAMNT_0014093949 /DNA_START=1395 /DNA_END=1874 /DNA_ORIENTATION=+
MNLRGSLPAPIILIMLVWCMRSSMPYSRSNSCMAMGSACTDSFIILITTLGPPTVPSSTPSRLPLPRHPDPPPLPEPLSLEPLPEPPSEVVSPEPECWPATWLELARLRRRRAEPGPEKRAVKMLAFDPSHMCFISVKSWKVSVLQKPATEAPGMSATG